MIYKKKIKPKEISFLQDEQTLYAFDFRALGESMDYDIPAMWKYENLMPWILSKRSVAVNEACEDFEYPNLNSLLVVKRGKDARFSVFKRLLKKKIPSKIKSLWVAVPHPDSDELARQKGLAINYAYGDFLFRNDKIRQKELMKKMTPAWKVIKGQEGLEELQKGRKQGFIKRKLGSGGYTVFDIKKIAGNEDFEKLFSQDDGEWYFEEFAKGKTYSVQCLMDKDSEEVVIFGYSQQRVADGKCFVGSEILSLDELKDDIFRQLQAGIRLMRPLLENYVGFFGIDFIVGKESRVNILEFNIRTTAATIPTLLANNVDSRAFYEEDLAMDKIKDGDVILAEDLDSKCVDIFRLYPNKRDLGVSFSFDFKGCKYIPKIMDQQSVEKISGLIEDSLSSVVSDTTHNFWPFGWTLCYILEESHCVISGWYLERRLTVDIFCCNANIGSEGFKKRLEDLFQPESTAVSRKIIR